MVNLSNTYKPSTAKEEREPSRSPMKLPDPDGEVQAYVVCLKKEAPFEYDSVLGLGLSKRIFPPEASLKKNEGRFFEPSVSAYALADNQVRAIWDRAKQRKKHIPARDGESEYTTTLEEWLIVATPEKFGDKLKEQITNAFDQQKFIEENKTEEEKVSDELLKEQKRRAAQKK